ncbi:Uncharacterised protein [Serratia quinivorans]|uniref:hypothetical protein n=1 Tax=Serratia quinivorans TaxID=137545 RepID=UPI002179C05E|nr:hypothetical protein [Serratia quinivorans]CAI1497631.1 Uncharacterised protein [Serratia quinivorans]
MLLRNNNANKLKGMLFGFLVIVIIFFLFDFSMQKVAEEKDGYTKSNVWAYYLYTEKDIRSAPKGDVYYYFTFIAQDGGQSRESSIVYSDDAVLPEVKKYLITLGYKVSAHDGLSEKWTKKDEVLPYFYISIDKDNHTLILSKVSFR